jgi:hypothetical protein
MSYSNPTWYGVGDPMAAQRAFQQSFEKTYNSAEEFFDGIDKEIEEKEATLQQKTNELRKELYSAKRAVPYTKQQVEALTRQFYEENKPGRVDEGGNFLKRAMTTKAAGTSTAKLDEAIANFKGMSNNLNMFTEAALSGNYNENTLDRGNSEYLKVMNVFNAYKNNPEVLQFKYENGAFEYNVVDKDGNTIMTMDELSASLQQLDPKVRKTIDDNKDEFIKKQSGLIKTMVADKYAEDAAAKRPGAIHGPQVAREEINKSLRLIQSESLDPKKQNFIYDQFNNNVDLGHNAKLELFKGVNVGSFNGATIVSRINATEDQTQKSVKLAALNNLLDVSAKDSANINELAGIIGITKEEANNLRDGINEFQFKAVEEYMVKEVLATGVDSKYVPKPKVTVSKTASQAAKDAYVYEYANLQGQRTFNTINAVSGRMMDIGDKLSSYKGIFGAIAEGGSVDKIDVSEIGVDKFRHSGGIFDIEGVTLGYKPGEFSLDLRYSGTGKTAVEDRSLKYNVYDPESMRRFYMRTATAEQASGKTATKLETKGYEMSMLNQLLSRDGMQKLADPNMGKWFDFVLDKGQKYGSEQILAKYLQRNPGLAETSNKWRLFGEAVGIL